MKTSLPLRRCQSLAVCVCALAALLSTSRVPAASPHFYDDDPLQIEPDTQDASGVRPWQIVLTWDLVENVFTRPGDRATDRRAMNVNTVDEVPNGAWFTNRAGARRLSTDEISRGANTGSGPVEGRWAVVSAKSDGITPGFTIRDRAGEIWFIKFDPPGWQRMATGTEVVAAKLFWALGYHTPEYHIATLRPEELVIEEGAQITPPGGSRRRIEPRDIEWLLERAFRAPDGGYRVSASKALPGKPLGGFRFYGTRPDDPNDVIPHEHRRELRGYGTFAAWFNHVDAKSINSLDTLISANGRAFVRHYLLDFGSTLGSAGVGPREYWEGHEYLVEPRNLAKRIVAFGLNVPPWRTQPLYEAPAVGRIAADDTQWDPEAWNPRVPNPAFLRARLDDKFWAARKASFLSEDLIRAAVVTGQLGDSRAEEALVRWLLQRRAAILRRYLPALNPVVDPALDGSGQLTFENAAVTAGVAAEPDAYRAEWATFDNATGEARTIGETTGTAPALKAPAGLSDARGAFVRVAISATDAAHPSWAAPVFAYFRRNAPGWTLVGFERMSDTPGPPSSHPPATR